MSDYCPYCGFRWHPAADCDAYKAPLSALIERTRERQQEREKITVLHSVPDAFRQYLDNEFCGILNTSQTKHFAEWLKDSFKTATTQP